MAEREILVSIKNISKTYKSGSVFTPALLDISLDIRDDDFLVIVGRNGSGKSTLLRQIGLLDKPDHGKILFGEKDLVQVSEKERSDFRLRQIGYVFQDYALMSDLTALENVMLPALMLSTIADARERARKLIEKVGLSKRANNLPSQLSGGEQQKVAIARSLINDPELIIADEPTANLDSVAAEDVIKIFKELNESGHTIVMVTHEKEEESAGSRKIELADGRIKKE
jgi:putative ABC transport system ATP-binding protein